jgi:hypothetical protein
MNSFWKAFVCVALIATLLFASGVTSGLVNIQGVTATGAAGTENPILNGALDGNGNKAPLTLGTLSTPVSLSTMGLTQIIPASSGKSIRLTHLTISWTAAVTFQLEYGTGTNCGTGTTALTGVYEDVGDIPLDFDLDPLIVPAGNALCANQGSAVVGGGLAKYALY